MKRITTILLTGLTTLFFTACGGGSSGVSTPPPPPPAPIEVNVLGTWDYAISTQGSVCDGKLAQGIEIIESLNGDTTKIGDILVQGTGFALDGDQNCYLDSVDETTSRAAGLPSTMTADEFLEMGRQINAGDDTIKSIRVDSFNNYKIVTVIEYTNGVIITSLLTRS